MAQEPIISEVENPVTEPIPQRDDREKIKRLVALKHLTHEAMMLDNIQKERKLVFDLAVQAKDGTLGKPNATEAFPSEGEEEMGVNVGNEEHTHVVHNHHYAAPPAPPAEVKAAVADKPSLASRAVKACIPLVLGTLPLGGAVGGYLLNQYFDEDPAVVEQIEPEIDIVVHPAEGEDSELLSNPYRVIP